jgi:hypothetical protein
VRYAIEELKNDIEVCEEAMLQNWEAIRDIGEEVKKTIKELLREFITNKINN